MSRAAPLSTSTSVSVSSCVNCVNDFFAGRPSESAAYARAASTSCSLPRVTGLTPLSRAMLAMSRRARRIFPSSHPARAR